MALLLRKTGVTRVRPLLGGIEAWIAARLPVEPLGPADAAAEPRGTAE